MPEKTDLFLTSFDTYWINWYVEFCQRRDIWERISRLLEDRSLAEKLAEQPAAEEPALVAGIREGEAMIVCVLHRAIREGHKTREDLEEAIASVVPLFQDRLRPDERTRVTQCLTGLSQYFETKESLQGIFEPIQCDKLRLFGEKRSSLIPELNERDEQGNSERVRYRLGENHQAEELLAVPYDANIGFLVYRRDLLKCLARERELLAQEIRTIFQVDLKRMKDFTEYCRSDGGLADNHADPALQVNENCVDKYVNERLDALLSGALPMTWEEVIALCKIKRHHFLIETQTFDTFTSTFLEIVWGCGTRVKIGPDYQFENRFATFVGIFQALCLLHRMFQEGVVPRNCSMEPEFLVKNFAASPSAPASLPNADWLFARHWYSTLADVLTRKKKDGSDFLWTHASAELELMPMPVSFLNYIQQRENGKTDDTLLRHSCWGEWYLAALKGSENMALAVDLLNNLMSSHKICERAFRSAGLPTVERFYKLYGKSQCFEVPERPGRMIPTATYDDLKSKYFPSALRRDEIFDYRHCMSELHSVLETLHASPSMQVADLTERLIAAVREVENLRKTDVLLR